MSGLGKVINGGVFHGVCGVRIAGTLDGALDGANIVCGVGIIGKPGGGKITGAGVGTECAGGVVTGLKFAY